MKSNSKCKPPKLKPISKNRAKNKPLKKNQIISKSKASNIPSQNNFISLKSLFEKCGITPYQKKQHKWYDEEIEIQNHTNLGKRLGQGTFGVTFVLKEDPNNYSVIKILQVNL